MVSFLGRAALLALLLPACGCTDTSLPLGGGQGAVAGLDGAAMVPQSAGSGASINDALSPGGSGQESTGPGGIYPPLE